MTERDSRPDLRLEIRERLALEHRKGAHLRLCECDVRAQLFVDMLAGSANFVVGNAERFRAPVVELRRVVADRVDPLALDPPEHLRHRLLHRVCEAPPRAPPVPLFRYSGTKTTTVSTNR